MAGGRTPFEQMRDRALDAEATLHALRLLHGPGNYETASRAVNPCCMVCARSEGWPCRTRREIDRVLRPQECPHCSSWDHLTCPRGIDCHAGPCEASPEQRGAER